MRRMAFGLAGAVAVVIAAAAALSLRAPADGPQAGARLVAAVADATGLDVAANGQSAVALFPRPSVRIGGVSVSRRGEPPFAVARELVGDLKLLPLLVGRLEIGDVTLDGAEIALEKTPFAEVLPAVRRSVSFDGVSAIRISDGRLGFRGQMVDKVEAGLIWPRDGGPLTLSGYGRFAGRPIEATAQLADLAALARSERAPFRARIEGGGARLMFDGEAIDRNGLRLSGEISARAASLDDVLSWLELRSPDRAGPSWPVSVAGRGAIDETGLTVSNAELDLSGESMLGAGRITVRPDGRPALEATLDAGALDLNPYLAALTPEMRTPDGRWSGRAIDLSWLSGWALDLRLSAERATVGRLALGPTAATVAIANGGLDLSIGEASAYGGTLGGRLTLEPGDGRVKVRVEGGASDVEIHKAIKDMIDKAPISGAFTADYAVEGSGVSVAEIVSGLSGRASARLVDGAIDGAARSRTLALAGLRGRIDVSRADANMRIDRGVAQADEVAIVGQDATFALSGSTSLVDLTIALKGSVKPAGRGWTLPVVIEGPLSSPKLKPDLKTGAARGEASHEQARTPVR